MKILIVFMGERVSMDKRNRIIYLPYPIKGNKINEYLTNMVGILQDEYTVQGSLAEPTDLLSMLQTKAVFLNWVENGNQLNVKMKLQLMLHKLFGAKIVWVFHNRYAHDTESQRSNVGVPDMYWLADHSSVIILHSRSSKKYIPDVAQNGKKAVYIPHILYGRQNAGADLDAVRKRYGISGQDFVFTMFGVVRPYKNIEGSIETFKRLQLGNAKLLIAGNPSDNGYARKIKKMCGDDPNIILDLQYISNAALDGIIGISDVVVMPYRGKSSMNSGVMIQSFSMGRTVITSNICMARDMAEGKFMYIYHYSLEKVMLKAYRNGKIVNRQMGERAREYVYQNNNREIVKEQLYKMIK